MRCLILDDDPSARILMETLIRDAGHIAMTCANLIEAAQAVAEMRFDVAIVDMELEDSTGGGAIQTIRHIAPHIKILVVSGHDDKSHVLEALDAGADGYLVKDEIGDSLATSLQEVRAGNTPLSPRVASVVLRELRRGNELKRAAGD